MKKILSIIFVFLAFNIFYTSDGFAAETHKKIKTHQSKKNIVTKKNKKSTKKIHAQKKYQPQTFSNLTSSHSFDLFSAFKNQVIGFVENTISSLNYSVYQLGGNKFDTSRGIYILDCSGYVDRLLQSLYPSAYSNLVAETGSDKPTTHDYYYFFTGLNPDSVKYWDKIETIEQLRPGDIIVFRNRNNLKNEIGGHVMIVMDKPTLNENADGYYVRVTDSAPSGHSEDTRPSRTSGIGVGTLVLKVNPKTYQPYAYAWKIGSQWKYNVNIAMARPLFAANQLKTKGQVTSIMPPI